MNPIETKASVGALLARRSKLGLLLAVGAVGVAIACTDRPILSCHDIPTGGCPLSGGMECQDPACATVYACDETNGAWIFDRACPAQDGGSVQDAGNDAADGGVAVDANIDAPPGAFGGPGCVALEPPDCPLGVALVCGGGCCGCTDLWVCDDGGWDPWGICTDDAGIVQQ